MVGQGDAAMITSGRESATWAQHGGRETAPVEKEYALLAFFETISEGLPQGLRQDLRRTFLEQFPSHVHQVHGGQSPVVDAFGQGEQLVFVDLDVADRLERRSGGAQNAGRISLRWVASL